MRKIVNALIEVRTSNCAPRSAVTTNTNATLTGPHEINTHRDSKGERLRDGCNTYYCEDTNADRHRYRSSELSYDRPVAV